MPTQRASTQSTSDSSSEVTTALEQRVIAFAEEMGRLVGTIQGRAETLSNRDTVNQQLARIRDEATALLKQFTRGKTAGQRTAMKGAAKSSQPNGRSGGKVDAPGKRHRKPAASLKGVKHSDQRIAKAKVAKETNRRQQRG